MRDGTRFLLIITKIAILFSPLRVFLPVSGILVFLAVGMAALNFILYRRAIPASAVFLGISAVIIFMLGLLTDQVSAIRREQHRRL